MTNRPNPRIRIDAHGEGIEQARDFFEGEYSGVGWSLESTTGPFSYSFSALGDDDMTLRTSRFAGTIAGELLPGDDYVVTWLLAGHGIIDVGRAEQVCVVGQPVVYPSERPFSFTFTDVEQKLVHFRRPLLERLVAERSGSVPGPLIFESGAVPTPATVRTWQNTLALVSRTTLDLEASPILQLEMVRIAGVAFLDMFPARSASLPPALLLPRNARLRIAVDYIHANAHLPVTATTIAAAADISVRALQEGFQRQFQQTPITYLRNVRLDQVRAELEEAGPGSVATVARKWGFAHLGRFSAAYCERFDEQPQQTAGRSGA